MKNIFTSVSNTRLFSYILLGASLLILAVSLYVNFYKCTCATSEPVSQKQGSSQETNQTPAASVSPDDVVVDDSYVNTTPTSSTEQRNISQNTQKEQQTTSTATPVPAESSLINIVKTLLGVQ